MRVELSEQVGATREDVTTAVLDQHGIAGLRSAVAWRCDRRSRHFVAATTRSDGSPFETTARVRTPTCEERFSLELPPWARPGTLVRAEVRDGWSLGDVTPRLCVRAARWAHPAADACASGTGRPGQAAASA